MASSCRNVVFAAIAAQCVASPVPTVPSSSPASFRPDLEVPDYVTRYAPLIWLHSEDPYRPSDLLTHIQRTTPMQKQVEISSIPELDLDNLALLNGYGDARVALTAKEDVTTMPDYLYGEAPDGDGRIHNSTPCAVVLVDHGPRDVDAFYFYFYSYDEGPNITQVLPPLNGLVNGPEAATGIHFGNHVGDWENNMIRFHDGEPTGIYYSQHRDGSAYDWDDETVSKIDGRPVVYSAWASHANYPEPGENIHDEVLIDFCDEGPQWDPVLSAYFYRFEPSNFTFTRLFVPGSTRPPESSNLTSFLYFDGIWGDEEYPDDDPRQVTIPYFGLKRFTAGPTGPRHKQLWRKGLYPDHRYRKAWIEWAVGVYMSLYPCCLKGWRAWVTTMLLVGIVVTVALGVKAGVRRYRTRGYRRLATEMSLESVERDEVTELHALET